MDQSAADLLKQLSGSPREILTKCDALSRDAYWKEKNLAKSVMILRLGIGLGMRNAEHATTDEDKTWFLGQVKTFAYNLASFTWPGWDEPGMVITPEYLDACREAAKLNLQLANDLNRPPDKLAAAHWMLGAANLAFSEWDDAIREFDLAANLHPNDLHAGYGLLGRILRDRSTQPDWAAHLQKLRTAGDDESKETLAQLETAHRVLASRRD